MKNNIYITLFLLVLSGFLRLHAQQLSRLHKWETKRILWEQQATRQLMVGEPNVIMNTSPHRPLHAEIAILGAIVPDFQVKENAGPYSVSHSDPSISTDGSGRFVITWTDRSNGDGDIYARRYLSTGSVLGAIFKVNDDQGTAYQDSPSVSTEDNGNFVITWRDRRNGNRDIYAQRYSIYGSEIGINFKVNDDRRGKEQLFPSISIDGSGHFVIAWSDRRNEDADIYAQRYSSNGTALGINFKANDDQGIASQWRPSISTDGSGNFVITWQDERHGDNGDIYAQRYSSDGTALGTNFKVNDNQGD